MADVTAQAARPAVESDRHACIMAAAIDLIAEVGYERMTMDAIAARAKASKATIYRRWDSKATLVVDALGCRVNDQPTPPDSGDLRTDLVDGLTALAEQMSTRDRGLVTGIFSALGSDPELARLVREQVFAAKRAAGYAWATQAIERGELASDADVELAHEIAVSIIFHRVIVSGDPVDAAFIGRIVDDVLMPVLTRNQGISS